MNGETILAAIDAACRGLGELGLRFALVGGAALPAWGRVRATGDADLLVAVPGGGAPDLPAVIDRLRAEGFAHHERIDRKRIDEHQILHFWFPVREQGVSVRVDLLIAEAPAHRRMLDRITTRRIDGVVVPVVSCEDLILLKLRAGRPVDAADAAALVAVNRDDLDMEYLPAAAGDLGVREALARLLEPGR